MDREAAGKESDTTKWITLSLHFYLFPTWESEGFPCGSAGKESACNTGDLGLIPGLGRSPGEGKGHPLQYSGLDSSMDCIVHGVGHNWRDCSLPSSSVHEILQARILEWAVMPLDLPNPGREPKFHAMQADSLPYESYGFTKDPK